MMPGKLQINYKIYFSTTTITTTTCDIPFILHTHTPVWYHFINTSINIYLNFYITYLKNIFLFKKKKIILHKIIGYNYQSFIDT